MKNRSPKVPGSTTGFTSATVDDVFAAFDTSSTTGTEGSSVDPLLMNHIKLLSKKDPQTRLKSLTDFLGDIRSRLEPGDIIPGIPLFNDAFIRGALLDPNWKCRALYHQCLMGIFRKVGGRALEAHVPRFLPIVFISRYDESNREVSEAANSLFTSLFPTSEKQEKVMQLFDSQLTQYLDDSFRSTPVTLSKQFRSGSAGDATPDEEYESIERHERVVKSCVKCISANFPDYPPGKIITLISPSYSPAIQLDAIRYLSGREDAKTYLSGDLVKSMVFEIITSGSSSAFLQDAVWELFRKNLVPAFSEKSHKTRLINFLELSDPRTWTSAMIRALPHLVPGDFEIIQVVNRKISETIILRNAKLFHSLSRLALELSSDSIEAEFSTLSAMTHANNDLKYSLVTSLKPGKIFDKNLSNDPVLLLLLVAFGHQKIEIEKISTLLYSISSLADISFVIENSQSNENLLRSLSTHPLILSVEWMSNSKEYIGLVDSALTNGWFSLGDFYTTKIAPLLSFENLFELVSQSTGEWTVHASAPIISDPEQFAQKIIHEERFADIFKEAVMFKKRKISTPTSKTTERDNGIIAIGRSDFDSVVEFLLLHGSLEEFFVSEKIVSESVIISVWKKICRDQNLSLSVNLCRIVKETVSLENMAEILDTWFLAAFVNGDDRLSVVGMSDLTDDFDRALPHVFQLLMLHRFEMRKFPNIHDFCGVENFEIFFAIWIVRNFEIIGDRDSWLTFLDELHSLQFDITKVVCELLDLLTSEKIQGRILDSLALVASMSDRNFRNEIESFVCKDSVPVEIRICAIIALTRSIEPWFVDLVRKIVDSSSTEISSLFMQIFYGTLREEQISSFLDLATRRGIRRYGERALVMSYPSNDCLLDSLYHVNDSVIGEFFVESGDVAAVETSVDKFVRTTGLGWEICEKVENFLHENASCDWAITTLNSSLFPIGETRLVCDDLEFTLLLSKPEFRENLHQRIIADSHDSVVAKLIDHLVVKFLESSQKTSGDFTTLFELSETLGGDEFGELKKIFLTLLYELGSELISFGKNTTISLLTEKIQLFSRWLQCLSPGEIHDWVSRGEAPNQLSETLVRLGISSQLIELSLANKYTNSSLKQSYSKSSKFLVCRYTTCGGEITAELTVAFPEMWPARLATIEVSPVAGLSKAKNSRLKISIQQVFRTNGVQNAVQIWIENIEGFLANVEECYICYSVTYHHGTKGTGSGNGTGGAIPDKECRNCHYKFHAQCLLKWFKQSQKTNCVLCQQPF